MKKFIILILSLFLISSCSNKINIDEKNYKEVLFDEIENKIKNKETFVYYIGSESCSSCNEYKENLASYFKENSDDIIYYVDVNKNFTSGQKYENYTKTLANISYELYGYYFGYNKDSLYTPTTFKVINGEYCYSIVGSIVKEKIKDIFDLEFNNISKNELNYDEVISLINSEEDYYLYFTMDGCSNCFTFNYLINSFEKQNKLITLNYLKFNKELIDDKDKYNNLKKLIYDRLENKPPYIEFEIDVPTIIKQKNKVFSSFVGTPTIEEFREILK